jgi:hypothetical protein
MFLVFYGTIGCVASSRTCIYVHVHMHMQGAATCSI